MPAADLGAWQFTKVHSLENEVVALRQQVTELQAAMREMRAAQATGLGIAPPGIPTSPVPRQVWVTPSAN